MESNRKVAFALGGVALAVGAQVPAQQVPIFPGSEIVVTNGKPEFNLIRDAFQLPAPQIY